MLETDFPLLISGSKPVSGHTGFSLCLNRTSKDRAEHKETWMGSPTQVYLCSVCTLHLHVFTLFVQNVRHLSSSILRAALVWKISLHAQRENPDETYSSEQGQTPASLFQPGKNLGQRGTAQIYGDHKHHIQDHQYRGRKIIPGQDQLAHQNHG